MPFPAAIRVTCLRGMIYRRTGMELGGVNHDVATRAGRLRRNLQIGVVVMVVSVALYITGFEIGSTPGFHPTGFDGFLVQQVLLSLGGVLTVFGGLVVALSVWALRHPHSRVDPERLEYVP